MTSEGSHQDLVQVVLQFAHGTAHFVGLLVKKKRFVSGFGGARLEEHRHDLGLEIAQPLLLSVNVIKNCSLGCGFWHVLSLGTFLEQRVS